MMGVTCVTCVVVVVAVVAVVDDSVCVTTFPLYSS